MDGRTLMEIMQSPNFSMWGPAQQAFDLGQQKNQADLASVVGAEKRATELQPVAIKEKEANIRQSDAAAGYSTAMKKQLEDQLGVLQKIPMSDRVTSHIAKMRSELSGERLKQADSEMESLLGAASTAAKNGGTLPLGYTLQNPAHAEYFKTPKGFTLASQIARAYFENKPKEMYAVSNDARDTARAESVARIGANASVTAANSRGTGGKVLKPPKNNLEAVYYYQEKARMAETEAESAQFAQMAQKAQEDYVAELTQKATLAAQSRLAGSVDMSAAGGVPTRPMPGVPSRNPPQQPQPPEGWSVKVK